MSDFLDPKGKPSSTSSSACLSVRPERADNLHYNVAHPTTGTDAELHAMQPARSTLVQNAVDAPGRSISAAQGIGRVRTGDRRTNSPPR